MRPLAVRVHLQLTLAFALALALTPATRARAQERDDATAQVLFNEARALMGEGRYAEACPKLEESERISPAIGTMFNLADCDEHVDRLASAWALFLRVAAETKAKGQLDREQAARARAKALEPRLAKLFIDVEAGARADGFEVKRDGQRVGEPLWGVGVPVDAGKHVVVARAPGRAPWMASPAIADAQELHVRVPSDLPPGPAASEERAPPPAPTIDRPATAPPAATTATGASALAETAGGTQRTVGWISIGASVAFLGAGVAGILARESAVNDYNADPSCPPIDSASKPPQCQDRVSAVSTWRTVTTVGFVGAGALAIAGVLLVVTAPSHAGSAVACGGGPGIVGLACGARF